MEMGIGSLMNCVFEIVSKSSKLWDVCSEDVDGVWVRVKLMHFINSGFSEQVCEC